MSTPPPIVPVNIHAPRRPESELPWGVTLTPVGVGSDHQSPVHLAGVTVSTSQED